MSESILGGQSFFGVVGTEPSDKVHTELRATFELTGYPCPLLVGEVEVHAPRLAESKQTHIKVRIMGTGSKVSWFIQQLEVKSCQNITTGQQSGHILGQVAITQHVGKYHSTCFVTKASVSSSPSQCHMVAHTQSQHKVS